MDDDIPFASSNDTPYDSSNNLSAAMSTPNSQFFAPPSQYFFPPEACNYQSLPYPSDQAQSFAAFPVNPLYGGEIMNENGSDSCLCQPHGVKIEQQQQQKGSSDPQKTKMARINRILARQRSLSSQRIASSTVRSSTEVDSRTLQAANVGNINNNGDLYKFWTPDNKRVRLLLKKELKNSDVTSMGRIVIPKREAEANLPSLHHKEGIELLLRDLYSGQYYTFKFKFWTNNKSRMYVLEQTGDFVKQYRLQPGDSIMLLEDENKNMYYSIKRKETTAEASLANAPNCLARDEDDASLAILIEQLKHREQPQATCTNLMNLSATGDDENEHRSSLFNNANGTGTGINQNSISDDCYDSLGFLPDVNSYSYFL